MDHHLATSRVIGTLAQLISPAGRPGARMLPLDEMRRAFARFIEYAEALRGDEHVDAERYRRALPFVRELAPVIDHWSLDAVPRTVTLQARRAWDAWFPDEDRTEFWAQTDRDAEAWAARPDKHAPPEPPDGGEVSSHDVELLRMALGQGPAAPANDAGQEEEPRRSDPADRAARMAMAMSSAINVAALLASPRALRKVSPPPEREHLLEHLDALLETLASGRLSLGLTDVASVREAATRLRAACAAWTPGPEAPPEVQQSARDLLAALGLAEPPDGGWDAFQGGRGEG
jgi:hypothetical protein